jgi:hypothetical protein
MMTLARAVDTTPRSEPRLRAAGVRWAERPRIVTLAVVLVFTVALSEALVRGSAGVGLLLQVLTGLFLLRGARVGFILAFVEAAFCGLSAHRVGALLLRVGVDAFAPRVALELGGLLVVNAACAVVLLALVLLAPWRGQPRR